MFVKRTRKAGSLQGAPTALRPHFGAYRVIRPFTFEGRLLEKGTLLSDSEVVRELAGDYPHHLQPN
jgi:hypothetical protein